MATVNQNFASFRYTPRFNEIDFRREESGLYTPQELAFLEQRDRQVEDYLLDWNDRYILRVGRTTNLLNVATNTDITWQAAQHQDDERTWSATTNPQRYVVVKEGMHQFYCQVRFDSNEADNTFTTNLQLTANGSWTGNLFATDLHLERGGLIVGDDYYLRVFGIIFLVPGDYVMANVTHTNSTNPDILGDGLSSTNPLAFSYFEGMRIGPRPRTLV